MGMEEREREGRAREIGKKKLFICKSLDVEDSQDLPAVLLPCDQIVVVRKNVFEKAESTEILVNDGFHVYLIFYSLVVPNFTIIRLYFVIKVFHSESFFSFSTRYGKKIASGQFLHLIATVKHL